jgi:hypothetical protein
MANVQAPFGFAHIGYLEGASPSQGNARRKIASGNATAINFGDPVVSLSTGYIARATAGTTQIAGIFVGCKYLSTSQQRTVWSRTGPAPTPRRRRVLHPERPRLVFRVQAGGSSTPIGFAQHQRERQLRPRHRLHQHGNSGASSTRPR